LTGRVRRLPIRVDTWALDPSGRYIAYGHSPHPPSIQQIRIYDLATGSRRILYRGPRHQIAPPQVAHWSADGRWVLFWPDFENSASLAADGLPLIAVSRQTGTTDTITPVMLVWNNFLTWCGPRLVAATGGDRYVTDHKRVILAAPPAWRARVLTRPVLLVPGPTSAGNARTPILIPGSAHRASKFCWLARSRVILSE